MAKTAYQNIDQYQEVFSGETLERIKTLRQIIKKTVPEAAECISYQIPCFKYKGYLIYYAAYPNHISISHPFSEAFLKHFETELKGYKVSKSVIQLPNGQPLPEKLIKEILAFRKKENEQTVKRS